MVLVTINPDFSAGVRGDSPSGASVNFGIFRRLFDKRKENIKDGAIEDIARINGSAYFTPLQFSAAVQSVILYDLQKIAEGKGEANTGRNIEKVEYRVGPLWRDNTMSEYSTVEIENPAGYAVCRQDIGDKIHVGLASGPVHGNPVKGLTVLYSQYFKPSPVLQKPLIPR